MSSTNPDPRSSAETASSPREGRLRSRPPRAQSQLADARRRTRHRQESPGLRAATDRRGRLRAHHVAAGALPRLRRRCHPVGAGQRSSRRRRESANRTRSRTSPRRYAAPLPRRSRRGDAAWVEPDLLALVGLAEETELGGNRRNEAFAAWRRFLEGMAEQRPLILVFEDLHWADEALLDFVDELVDWLTDVPLLVVATSRPELLERRTELGRRQVERNDHRPRAAQRRGDGAAPRQRARHASRRGRDADRAPRARGWKPLVRGAVRRALRRTRLDGRAHAPGDAPGHLRRALDGLGFDEKALVLDAAVVGKVFWTAAARTRRGRRLRSIPFTGAQGIRPAPASLVRRRSDRGGLRARTGPRCRLRPDSAGRSRAEAPQGRRVDRIARQARRSRRDARLPLALCARSRASERRGRRRAQRERTPLAPGRRRPRIRAQQLRGVSIALRRRSRALAVRRPRRACPPLPLGTSSPLRLRRGPARAGTRDRATHCSQRATGSWQPRPRRSSPTSRSIAAREI